MPAEKQYTCRPDGTTLSQHKVECLYSHDSGKFILKFKIKTFMSKVN